MLIGLQHGSLCGVMIIIEKSLSLKMQLTLTVI